MLLQEFQYQVKMKPEIENKNINYLSKLKEEEVKYSIVIVFLNEYLFTITEEEDEYAEILKYLKEGVILLRTI